MMTAFRSFLFLTLLTGALYPLIVTVIAQVGFPALAQGLPIEKAGGIIGSHWIGQKFAEDRYFHGRPSAVDFVPMPSGGSNLSITSEVLRSQVDARVKAGAVGDLRFASGSGLDPHISPAAAESQIERVARARGISVESLGKHVRAITEGRQFGIFGEPRVNVLSLNESLDNANERERK